MRKRYKIKEKEICTEAITFARVSSEKQERGASIDAQKELIFKYCAEKNLKIIKEFEITESSTRGDRVKYKEMLNFIRSRNKKTAIVVNCVDRLQRSDDDNPALNKLRKDGKIELHFMKENIILDETSPVNDIFTWKINVLMAGNYTDSLSFNVKRSLVQNWNSGKWQNAAPIGYLNARDENCKPTIIVDEERGPIIRKLFEEYANGQHSLDTIWELSKTYGLKSKIKKDKYVSKNALYDALTNPFYYGEMYVKGQKYKHIYPPLIDKDLFDKVQKKFEQGHHNRNNTTEYAKNPYTFRGMIHCKECGHLITPETKIKKNGKKYIYLRCSHCKHNFVNEDTILNQLYEEIFSKIALPENMIEIVKKSLLNKINDESNFNASMKHKSSVKLEQLTSEENDLFNFLRNNKISSDFYDRRQAAIQEERKSLIASMEKLKTISNDVKNKLESIFSHVGNILILFNKADAEKRNLLLNMMIANCKLSGNKLEYDLQKPFDKLIQSSSIKDWSNIALNNIDEFCNLKFNI